MLIADIDGRLAGFVAVAVSDLEKRLSLSAIKAPPGTAEPAAALEARACKGLSGPTVAQLGEVLDAVHMTRLTVDYDEGAAALHVSQTTLTRLVATGEIPTVSVDGAVRIRVTDLTSLAGGSYAGSAGVRPCIDCRSCSSLLC